MLSLGYNDNNLLLTVELSLSKLLVALGGLVLSSNNLVLNFLDLTLQKKG